MIVCVLWLFLTVPCVIVVYPDHTHLLLWHILNVVVAPSCQVLICCFQLGCRGCHSLNVDVSLVARAGTV